MSSRVQPIPISITDANSSPVIDQYLEGTMLVIRHQIYEYEKGLRSLVLQTVRKNIRELVEVTLEKREIDFLIYRAGENNINVFFGDPVCLNVVRAIGKEKLAEYTNEEDFILGTMLGYCRVKQCRRYLDRRGRNACNTCCRCIPEADN